jgi:hypothetical protein
MKRCLFRYRCGELGIDYDIDIETQQATITKPPVECEDCAKLTANNSKTYSRVSFGVKTPYWMKKCGDCGEKTPLYRRVRRRETK